MTALVICDGKAVTVGGLTLVERAVAVAHRIGLGPLRVWGPCELDDSSRARIRARGIAAARQAPADPPLHGVVDPDGVVVIDAQLLVAPATLASFVASQDGRQAGGAGEPVALLYIPLHAIDALRHCRSVVDMATQLRQGTGLQVWPSAGALCHRVADAEQVRRVERAFIRHLNGRESFFTKKIRRFSVPLSSHLVRLGARPTHVTLGGLMLAAGSAWCFATGGYLVGLLAAALYYASMVCDCSDGEVARLTLRDDSFGAWFETVVDYTTYFLLLGALFIASRSHANAGAYRVAAIIAAIGSVVLVGIMSYLRHRVASDDPGQFDDASARVLRSSTRMHRFARWGRQWIKRSTIAHLVVALAVINQPLWLVYLWAFGVTVALVVTMIVGPFVVRRVSVARPHAGLAGHH